MGLSYDFNLNPFFIKTIFVFSRSIRHNCSNFIHQKESHLADIYHQ